MCCAGSAMTTTIPGSLRSCPPAMRTGGEASVTTLPKSRVTLVLVILAAVVILTWLFTR